MSGNRAGTGSDRAGTGGNHGPTPDCKVTPAVAEKRACINNCTCDGIVYNLYRLTCLILIGGISESDEVLVIDPADVTLSRRDSARLRVSEFNEPFDVSNCFQTSRPTHWQSLILFRKERIAIERCGRR